MASAKRTANKPEDLDVAGAVEEVAEAGEKIPAKELSTSHGATFADRIAMRKGGNRRVAPQKTTGK